MPNPNKIVKRLLEGDEDYDPEEIASDLAQQRDELVNGGVLTLSTILSAPGFYHRTQRYKSRGKQPGSPLYARRNGATKTWKRQPGKFLIPMKYGMYEHFYITNQNAHEWSTVENPTSQAPPGFYGPPPAREFFDT